MGIVIDIVIIAIVAFLIFIEAKKGIVNVIFNLGAFAVSLLLTVVLLTPVTNYVINNTTFDETIENSILESGIIEQNPKEETTEDDNIGSMISSYVKEIEVKVQNGIFTTISRGLAESVVKLIVAIGLFVIIRIILVVVKCLTHMIASLPIIKELDKIGGGIYGFLKAMLVLHVVFAVIFLLTSIDIINITEYINSSIIAKFLYTNNLIINILF